MWLIIWFAEFYFYFFEEIKFFILWKKKKKKGVPKDYPSSKTWKGTQVKKIVFTSEQQEIQDLLKLFLGGLFMFMFMFMFFFFYVYVFNSFIILFVF